MKLVLASSNVGKLVELRDLLGDTGIELHAQSEFGVGDAEETGLSFIENAILKARHAARATGLPFERYYHGCFVDNWEWAEGEVPRFGIVDLDYATLERTVKSSGRFYADVIAEGGVTDEIAARYLSS